jgi:hypothetical protein
VIPSLPPMANDGGSQSLESDAMLPPYVELLNGDGTNSSDSNVGGDNGYMPPPPYSEQKAATSDGDSIDGGKAAVRSMV